MRNILILQAFLIIAAAVFSYGRGGLWAAQSALYGGAIALANSLLLARRVTRAGATAQTDTKKGAFIFYIGAVQRFIVTLVAFGVGLGLLKLSPLPLLIAFALAQLAYVFGARH